MITDMMALRAAKNGLYFIVEMSFNHDGAKGRVLQLNITSCQEALS